MRNRLCLSLLCFGLLLGLGVRASAQECDIIFVTPNGATTGAAGTVGTRANPAEINFAVNNLLNASIRKVYMAVGSYSLNQVFPLHDSLTIEGGFSPVLNWTKTNFGETYIYRDTFNIQPSPNRLVAIQGINKTGFRLAELTIITANAVPASGAGFTNEGTTAYGVYLTGCSNYVINRCFIRAGGGSNGVPGAPGAVGATGANGALGGPGSEDGNSGTGGGAGGSGWSGGARAGGNGGNGGSQGCTFCGSGNVGQPGLQGQGGPLGGFPGSGGTFNVTFVSFGCDNDFTSGYDGNTGLTGGNGLGRADNPPLFDGGPGVFSHTAGFFVPGNGQPGVQGQPGGGGGGGGGGGSQSFNTFGSPGAGAGGGGGGEGGQGGFGGQGGGGGGGSFGLYINANGTGAIIRDCEIYCSLPGGGVQGGAGGPGGFGGLGGFGGARGIGGQPVACDIGAGGGGGNGGNGGAGGYGGIGANGDSAAIYVWSNGTNPTVINQNNVDEPYIVADFTGCTNNTVRYTLMGALSQNITWFFGSGANPAIAVGSNVITQYTTTGYKTITVIDNGISSTYADFLQIRTSGAGTQPSIVSADDTICAGQIPTFASSISGTGYYWSFDGAAPDSSSAAAQTYTGSVFSTPGDYTVTLRTTSGCCGYSEPDTFNVHVRPLPTPSVTIATLGGVPAEVCAGDTLGFQANAQSAGSSPVYIWRVNGVTAQSGPNQPVFFSSSLADGDVVSLALVVTNDCVTNDTIFSNDITVTINALPVFTAPDCQLITAVNGEFAPGQPLQMVGNSGGNNSDYTFYWDFGNGSGAIGTSVFAVYPQSGTYTVSLSIQDANGCFSLPASCTGTVTIEAVPTAAFSANAFAGCAPFSANFVNQSQNALTYLWNFGDGTAPVTTASPAHTFITAGTYNVTLQAFSTGGNDTSIVVQAITVHPTPSADFVAIPTTVLTATDSVFFTHTSVGANSWEWNFGDPASGVNNTATGPSVAHFYALEDTYTVTLIVTNDFGCRDTIVKNDYVRKVIVIGRNEANMANATLQVYPNPFGAELNLRVDAAQACEVSANLLSLTGQQVAVFPATTVSAGPQELRLNTPESLSPGVYLLRVSVGGVLQHIKVIYSGR